MYILAFDCSDPDFQKIISLVRSLMEIIQILVPIGLIVMGSIDLGKAVISSSEDNIKKSQHLFIKRCIAAVLVFLVVMIVNFVMSFVGNSNWQECWNPTTMINSSNDDFNI
jgi:hypothetical protein